MSEREAVLAAGDGTERLDRLIAAAWPDLSRSRLQALVRAGHLSLDGRVMRDPSSRIAGGHAALHEPPPAEAAPRPEPIPLAVVHEDDDLVVVDKPAGLVVHPGAGHDTGTLVHALLAHCGDSLSGIGGVKRPGIVHRLDRDTSGLLVVAKTDRAHRGLSGQFADHGRSGPMERAYLAFCWGVPEPRAGEIHAALARSAANRERIAVVPEGQGRHALTRYRVEESYAGQDGEPVASLLRCRLATGRTHQIRVHMAHRRHPLVGDALYGAGFRTKAARLAPACREAVEHLGRQALHATLLAFAHPVSGAVLRFESPLPPDLAALRSAFQEAPGGAG